MVTLSLSLLLIASGTPKWLDDRIAGYVLTGGSERMEVGVYDAARNYYLLRRNDGDTAYLTLLLTRDREKVVSYGFHVQNYKPKKGENGNEEIVSKPLRNLSTGKGLKIGDSPATVRKLLGAPGKTAHSGARRQFLDWSYHWRTKSRLGNDIEYDEWYTFKAGHLIEIEFYRGLVEPDEKG